VKNFLLHPFLLALLGGILSGLAFPPFLGFLCWFGYIPILIALESAFDSRGMIRKKYAAVLLYIAFFTFHGIANWWVGSWQKEADPFLMIAGIALWIGHPFFLMLPMVGYLYLRRRIPATYALAALPLLWTAFEWLHSLTDASYPWLSTGYALINNSTLVQAADLAGVWGLSFLIIAVNCCIYAALNVWRQTKSLKSFLAHPAISIACSIVLGIFTYGQIRLAQVQSAMRSAPQLNAAVVQPNINPWKKWAGGVYAQLDRHFALQDSLLALHPETELFVWSETAIPYMNKNLNSFLDFSPLAQRLPQNSGKGILTGFAEIHLMPPSPKNEPLAKPFIPEPAFWYVAQNSATIIQQGQKPDGMPVHRKMHLTPFGEGVPFAQDFEFLAGILEWGVGISGWKKGTEQQPLPFLTKSGNTAHIGIVICIESIYPNFVRLYANKGANLLSIITNDAWFDNTPGPVQHYDIARMRAIENHKSILRCGNTGISGFILPDGSSSAIAPACQSLALAGAVPLMEGQTLYAAWGDYLPKISFILAFGILCYAGYRYKNRISGQFQ
jgi:apolipoprotein N-acyltransferase